MGRPGIGKTTMLREAARVLADELEKRVVVVDTSNEIAGDGDIPHPGIGRARRMQVRTPDLQHSVMIEAVENHMPEVIVIDEIGTELEAGCRAHDRRARRAADRHGPRQQPRQPDAQPDAVRPDRRHPERHPGRRGGAPPAHAEERARAQGAAHVRRGRRDPVARPGDGPSPTWPRRSTRCCAATRSRPSCAGATKAASTGRRLGRGRVRSRRCPASALAAWLARAVAVPAPSPGGSLARSHVAGVARTIARSRARIAVSGRAIARARAAAGGAVTSLRRHCRARAARPFASIGRRSRRAAPGRRSWPAISPTAGRSSGARRAARAARARHARVRAPASSGASRRRVPSTSFARRLR